MRRIICFLMAICLLVPLALPAAAEESNTVTPRYTYIRELDATIDFDSNGVATCTVNGKAVSASHKVSLQCHFQGYSGTGWISIRNWTASGNYSVTTTQTANARADCLDYRLWVLCQIKDSSGNVLETTTIYEYDYYIP